MHDFDHHSSAVAVSPHSNFKKPLPPYTKSSSSSTSTFPKSPPVSSSESSMDDVNMDGTASSWDAQSTDNDSSNEVQWQSSQASSVLESLLVRSSLKSRRTTGSAGKGSGSCTPSRLSMGSTASSSSSMSSPGGSGFVWPVTGNLDANARSTVAAPSVRRKRPSALSSTCRKSNLSSSSTASSSSSSSRTKGGSALPSKKEDITESFKLFVKQVTSKVDENLAHNAPNINLGAAATADAGSSTSRTGLSRSNSRNALLYGGITRHHSKSGKPLSASGVASAAAASGVTTTGRRPLQGRTLSANAIFSGSGSGGREHRVGGDYSDVRGKGKAKESHVARGADDMDMDVDTPAAAWKVPRVHAGSTTASNGIANAGVAPPCDSDTYAMPPALPPERLQQGYGRVQPNTVMQNPVMQQQRPQPPIVPAISVIPSSQQSIQDSGVPVPAPSQQLQQPFKPPLSQISHQIFVPAPASGAFHVPSTSTTTTATTKVTTPAPTTTHSANVPAAPVTATTTIVRSSKPPPLGMRRAHTFSSTAHSNGNNGYTGFGSQQPASSQGGLNNPSRNANGLPTKQRAFKAPSFQRPPQAQPAAPVQLQVHQGVNATTATTTTSNAPSTSFSRASSTTSFSSSVFKPTPSGPSSDTSLGVPAAPGPVNNAYVKTQVATPVGGTTANSSAAGGGVNQNQNQNYRQARFKPPTPTFAPGHGVSTASANSNSNLNSGNAATSNFTLARSKSSESTASSGSNNSIQSLGFERLGRSSSGTSVNSNTNSGAGSSGKSHVRGELEFELGDASEEEERAEGGKEGDDDSSMLVESGEDPDSSYGDISFDLDELEDVCSKYD